MITTCGISAERTNRFHRYMALCFCAHKFRGEMRTSHIDCQIVPCITCCMQLSQATAVWSPQCRRCNFACRKHLCARQPFLFMLFEATEQSRALSCLLFLPNNTALGQSVGLFLWYKNGNVLVTGHGWLRLLLLPSLPLGLHEPLACFQP